MVAQAEASTLTEAVAQYVENWCYEPDGKSREHICCTATACDIANSIRRDGLPNPPTTPAVESGEPYGYLYEHGNGDYEYRETRRYGYLEEDGWTERPLYSAPAVESERKT